MKNKDKYLEDFVRKSLIEEDGGIHFMKEHGISDYFDNNEPMIVCIGKLLAWFEEEYQEPITLTDDEKVVLKNINKDYKWVARDNNENLYVYVEKPIRVVYEGEWTDRHRFITIDAFKHLFKFIKWEDEEAWEIDKLLSENGVKRDEE